MTERRETEVPDRKAQSSSERQVQRGRRRRSIPALSNQEIAFTRRKPPFGLFLPIESRDVVSWFCAEARSRLSRRPLDGYGGCRRLRPPCLGFSHEQAP
jgi:hypothetical protein